MGKITFDAWLAQYRGEGEMEITDPESGILYDVFEITEELIHQAKQGGVSIEEFEKNEYAPGEKLLIGENEQGFLRSILLSSDEFESFRKETEAFFDKQKWIIDSQMLSYDENGVCNSEYREGVSAATGQAWNDTPAWVPALAGLVMTGEVETVHGKLSDIVGKSECLSAVIIANGSVGKKIRASLTAEMDVIYREYLNSLNKWPKYVLIEMDGRTQSVNFNSHTTLQAAEAEMKDWHAGGIKPKDWPSM